MTESMSLAEKWWNLVRFAQRQEIATLKITPVQRREIICMPYPGLHPFSPGLQGRPETLFGHPIEVVWEGFDLWSAMDECYLGPPRQRHPRP